MDKMKNDEIENTQRLTLPITPSINDISFIWIKKVENKSLSKCKSMRRIDMTRFL